MFALIDQLDRFSTVLSRRIALIGVSAMLLIAGSIIADVLMRWLSGRPITGLNEAEQLALSIAIAATFPAGAAQRVNLTVDILLHLLGRATVHWLKSVGALALLVFYGLLAWQIGVYAGTLDARGAATVFLGWKTGPFMWVIAAFFGATALVQALVFLAMLKDAVLAARPADLLPERRFGEGRFLLGALVLLVLAALVSVGASDGLPLIARDAQAMPWLTALVLFAALWALSVLLIPLTAIMGLIGLVGIELFLGIKPGLIAFATETTGMLNNDQIATLPLFLMMGSFAAVADISEDVYRLAHVVFGRLRGGLALTTIAGCAGFGALTGHSLSTTVTIGKVALPEMRARGYSPAFSSGVCAAGGTLGALLPPASGPLILFALLSEASVGQLFVAAIVPGLLATALYLVTIAIYVRVSPESAPLNLETEPGRLTAALSRCGPAALLFGSVMGGIYFGIFTATEAAAFGAFESFLCALLRGKLRGSVFWEVMAGTTSSTAMIYGLIFGAQIFSYFVGVTGLTESATTYISNLNWAPIAVIAVILVVYLLLGSVMESFAVMVITVPIVTPLILHLGYDVLWWGIINLCVVETGLIHPPLGLNVFVLKSIQPDVPISTVYKGVLPFVVADLVKLVLLVVFPILALCLV